jgi:NADP-dependent 3-hydroxy acid dehydrogenase YdfG
VYANGRTAIVTGASSGIGAATVRSLAAAGFDVVAAARRLERCEEVAKEIGGRALRLDVTDPDSVAELAEAVPEAAVLVNNAGGSASTRSRRQTSNSGGGCTRPTCWV